MAIINLTNQSNINNTVKTQLLALKNILDQYRPYWDKLSYEKKRQLIKNEIFPLLNTVWSMYKYLKDFFDDEDANG